MTRTRPPLVSGLLKVAELVTTPLVPSDYLDLIDPLRAGAELRGRIVRIIPETAEAATVVIRPGRGWAGHTPGQYVRLGVEVDGVRLWRAYSLTGRADGPEISITVKCLEGGLVSNHLVRNARPGQLVMLDQAKGDFVLPEPPPPAVLFVTAGSGITPVMGILRNRLDELSDVVLIHSAPTAQQMVFGPELRTLAAAGKLRLLERHTDIEPMFSFAELDALVPDWGAREAWVCGPTAMLDAAELYWGEAGLDGRVHTERFRPSVLGETGEGGTVTFSGSEVTVEADGDRPLLEVGEEAGVLMPSGCRMGICFGCASPLASGAVRDLRTGEVTTAQPGDNVVVQTCVSAAAGACDIEL